LVEHHQIYSAGFQRGRQFDQVRQGAAEPIKFGDDELVAVAVGRKQRLVQLAAAGQFPGCGVDENLLTAGRGKRVVLGLGVLVAGGDP